MENLIIRKEREEDHFNVEYMTKRAFWNLHVPGCSEHYLVHILRKNDDYIEELSRVAEINGEIVGAIMYSKSYVTDGIKKTEVLTFGPLCVEPSYQNKGIGKALLETTMDLARKAGHKAIIIYGEPEYYPKFGFKTCDNFGITTKDSKNFSAFMGIELINDGLKDVHGKFFESKVFENLDTEKVEEFDKQFPYMQKLKLPGQWE
ncbi:N-acetyltransferase [Clostridium tertium]|uniref:GNAT family N-acetyltransferase n=1 Tax=Clostridium tertium TaxID=1559 RepID=UPI00232DDEAF|nr:N-acetyltransferase [Clostridium tertium]MDB1922409.1 N-acetyltransferase [Clostridium tertium]MDB1926072.1 N-acetyltransferase [Clostridium tertium]MDB1929605.1 N-acetyltransferase [Clostridium tertium]